MNIAIVQRESSVRRPPSMDYKPRRSESEAAPGAQTSYNPMQSAPKSDGTAHPGNHTVSPGPLAFRLLWQAAYHLVLCIIT